MAHLQVVATKNCPQSIDPRAMEERNLDVSGIDCSVYAVTQCFHRPLGVYVEVNFGPPRRPKAETSLLFSDASLEYGFEL